MASNTLTFGIYQSPFGMVLIAVTPKGISRLVFVEKGKEKAAVAELTKLNPQVMLKRSDAAVAQFGKQAFASTKSKTPLEMSGTPFQLKVWKALRAIPRGKVATYGDIAKKIGAPRAARAVGSACGKNRIAMLIPCHRVVGSTGTVGHYHWGSARKKKLLEWESAK